MQYTAVRLTRATPHISQLAPTHPKVRFAMLKMLVTLQSIANSLRKEEDGNAAEYGLIIGLVAVGIIAALIALAAALSGQFGDVTTELNKK